MTEAAYLGTTALSEFRLMEPGRDAYRFTVDDVYAMQRLGVISGKGTELIDGVLLMRGSDIPVRLHSQDLITLYEAGIIPAHTRTELIEGVIYQAAASKPS